MQSSEIGLSYFQNYYLCGSGIAKMHWPRTRTRILSWPSLTQNIITKYALALQPCVWLFDTPVIGASGSHLRIYGQQDNPCTIVGHQ